MCLPCAVFLQCSHTLSEFFSEVHTEAEVIFEWNGHRVKCIKIPRRKLKAGVELSINVHRSISLLLRVVCCVGVSVILGVDVQEIINVEAVILRTGVVGSCTWDTWAVILYGANILVLGTISIFFDLSSDKKTYNG